MLFRLSADCLLTVTVSAYCRKTVLIVWVLKCTVKKKVPKVTTNSDFGFIAGDIGLVTFKSNLLIKLD